MADPGSQAEAGGVIRYLTAGEIARLFHRPIGTVYRLASEDKWRRVPDGLRPVLYHAEDVELTFARLTGAAELTSDLRRSII